MSDAGTLDRRAILLGGAAAMVAGVGVGVRAVQPPPGAPPGPQEQEEERDEGVSPGEDLMREHGVLNRVLLVYEAYIRRIDAGEEAPPEPLADAAGLIRTFIEDYHERIEEDHLFPRYRSAGVLVDLVDVLVTQHEAGRRVTERISALATARSLRDPDESHELARLLGLFVRMYRPHEAREDTVLFPALHRIVSRNEYDALGEQFERIERRQLGEEGFERAVERVAEIEKRLGLYDLAQFTPAP